MSKSAAEPQAHGEAAPAGKPLMAKLKIPGIILAIVLVEGIAAYLYLPGAPAATAAAKTTGDHGDEHGEEQGDAADEHAADDHGDAHAKDDHGDDAHKPKKDDHAAEKKDAHGGGHGDSHGGGHGEASEKKVILGDYAEIDLGQFNVTGYQPVSNTTLIITFHLYGTVKTKHNDDFLQRLDESKHRVRDNIIAIIRSAEITDLTDAGLGLIKRRVLETTNKTLGKPLVQSVMFSEFSFFEQ